MTNIFQQMTGANKPKILPQKPAQITKDSLTQAVINWKQDKSSDNTAAVLHQLLPTINSALKSFTPGLLDKFKIKAAKIALASLDGYDPAKKVSPSTFVFTNLQRLNRIRHLRLNIIHIPLSAMYLQQQVKNAIDVLNDRLDREPNLLEISDYLHLAPKKIQKIMLGNTTTINDSSVVNQLTGNSTFSLKDTTDLDYTLYLYNSVDAIDKRILLMATGFRNSGKIVPNSEIAKKLKLSPGAVSQRKAKMQAMMSLIRGLI